MCLLCKCRGHIKRNCPILTSRNKDFAKTQSRKPITEGDFGDRGPPSLDKGWNDNTPLMERIESLNLVVKEAMLNPIKDLQVLDRSDNFGAFTSNDPPTWQ